jgi:hypothetical protein
VDSCTIPTGVNGIGEHDGFRAWPNPAANRIRISYDGGISSVTVTDALGRQVFSGSYPGSSEVAVDMSALTPGTYYVQLNKLSTLRVVKE